MGYIEVDGLRELNRAVRKAADRDLGKRLGQANKKIGQFIIDHLDPSPTPAAVGAGGGAAVRPSATKAAVVLRVGGAHRDSHAPAQQWGRRAVAPFRSAPPRPYIQRSALRNQDKIEQFWLEAISQAMDPAFYRTDP